MTNPVESLKRRLRGARQGVRNAERELLQAELHVLDLKRDLESRRTYVASLVAQQRDEAKSR